MTDRPFSTVPYMYHEIINKFHNHDAFCHEIKNIFMDRKIKLKTFRKLYSMLTNDKQLFIEFDIILYRFNTYPYSIKKDEIEFLLKCLANAHKSVIDDEVEEIGKTLTGMQIEDEDEEELINLFKKM
jgi:hypothetical protein